VENAYSKFVIPSRLEPKAKTSEESAFLFPSPASEKKTRPFVEIRECRLILLLELACDAKARIFVEKMGTIPKVGTTKARVGRTLLSAAVDLLIV
jgi:hypothetical protein